MRKIERKLISHLLRRLNRELGRQHGNQVTLSDLDGYVPTVRAFARQSEKKIAEELHQEVFLTRLGIQATSFFALSVGDESEGKVRLIPKTWLSPDEVPEPDVILKSWLVQIANYCTSILSLVEKGYDNPARALLRSTIELMWQTLILLNRKDLLLEYCSAHTKEDANKVWFRIFGKGKLHDHLERLEISLGLPKDEQGGMKSWRKQSIEFYSQAVHHSFVATVVGANSFKFGEDENVTISLFGCPSPASRSTLNTLNYELAYFFIIFLTILRKDFNSGFPLADRLAYHGFVCKELFMFFMLKLRGEGKHNTPLEPSR